MRQPCTASATESGIEPGTSRSTTSCCRLVATDCGRPACCRRFCRLRILKRSRIAPTCPYFAPQPSYPARSGPEPLGRSGRPVSSRPRQFPLRSRNRHSPTNQKPGDFSGCRPELETDAVFLDLDRRWRIDFQSGAPTRHTAAALLLGIWAVACGARQLSRPLCICKSYGNLRKFSRASPPVPERRAAIGLSVSAGLEGSDDNEPCQRSVSGERRARSHA
jgi:hypothetical protein